MRSATSQTDDPGRRAGRLAAAYRRRFASAPRVITRAPGRVTLLGAHVDTSEGWVLPVAIERAVLVAAGGRPDRQVRLVAADLDDEARLDLDRLPAPVGKRPEASGGWADYAAGVAWALAESGETPAGMNALVSGDLPMASGLSSSAALESALLLAWEELSGFRLAPLDRARLGQRVETGYLALASGIMDQFVILHAERGSAVLLDCRSLTHELIPLPAGARLVVADSGVRRRLVGSAFNSRREECRQALELLRRALPRVRALRDVTAEQLATHRDLLPPQLERRARHVVEECRRTLRGAAALRRGDLDELGRLMRRSQASSRELYESSLPELDVLAAAAGAERGCYGARFSGAGFGGCVAALVAAEAAPRVAAAMREAFSERFGRPPAAVFTSAAAGAAGLLQ